ncbi:thiamine pyrophosphokinase [Lipomyces kononenkoae]|uniref:Thiamine pyrophosphokinase n=1 Tax=Lipomyces kononenkoae TaxID=34357 RepID=A0ACC3T3L5_LIPKO
MPLTEEDIASGTYLDRASILLGGDDDVKTAVKPFALIVLNQPVTDLDMLDRVWSNAAVKICADGGTNRLYGALDESTRAKYKPDFIAGDLDSLRPEIRKYYETELGVPVYYSPDQDSTDFGKCLLKLGELYPGERFPVVALGGTGGRVDQEFHSIHTLFVHERGEDEEDTNVRSDKKQREITLLSDDSLTFLAGPGTQTIHTPRTVLGPTCGIIPVAGPTVISTKGFTWDVSDWATSLGTQVSTSNALEADAVVIKSDKTVLFTLEIRR